MREMSPSSTGSSLTSKRILSGFNCGFLGPNSSRPETMSRFESITIREVESSDLETFYEHQLDPEAIRMAAFAGKDPKDKVAFDAHWNKILNSSQSHRGRSLQRDKSLVT